MQAEIQIRDSPSQITIVVADDHPIFRRGLTAVIESDAELKVIAEADNGEEALSLIEQLDPDVAVIDVNMPVADGLVVARAIQARSLPTVPVFLTMHKDEAIFNAALQADVKGFVVKDGAASEIVTCIKTVMTGQCFFSSVLTQFLLNRQSAEKSLFENLTVSERRILRFIGEGKANREIADELFISVRTVEHHREHIAAKLGLKGKHAILTFALTNKGKY